LTDGLLKAQPRNWEALYLEGVARVGLKQSTEAARRFRAILDLRLADDELSVLQGGGKQPKGAAAGSPPKKPRDFPLKDRLDRTWQIQQVTSLGRAYPGAGAQSSFWSPADFGQARMAALAWLFSLARKE